MHSSVSIQQIVSKVMYILRDHIISLWIIQLLSSEFALYIDNENDDD